MTASVIAAPAAAEAEGCRDGAFGGGMIAQ